MRNRPWISLMAGALAIAGCGGPPELAIPLGAETADGLSVQHSEEPVDFDALDQRVYCSGEARSTTNDWWGCSTSTGRDAAGNVSGTFLLANSLRNQTLVGTLTGGTFTRNAGGGGVAELTGTLSTGVAITLRLTDANSPVNRDILHFQTGSQTFTGEVRHGGIRLMRTLPLAHGTENHSGFRFDPRIGLFILQGDLDGELAPAPEILPAAVLEVVRPDPVINFKADQVGGSTNPPGSDDNVPPS